jgi:hypothetical protein
MKFFTIRAEDKDKISKIIGDNPGRICENTFGSMYIWSVNDEYSYCIEDNVLYFGILTDKKADFYFPIGYVDIKNSLDKLVVYCKENNLELNFSFLESNQAEIVKNHFGESVIVNEDRDWADYLYNYEDLLYLKGKKYNGQRNHINRFLRTYPNHEFLPYDISMHDETLAFLENHFSNLKKSNQWLTDEWHIMKTKLLPQFPELGQLGGVLKIDGKIVAVTFGEVVGDTLYVHFEKADRKYHGSYPKINQSFASFCYKEGLKYINREEDLGDLGLRTAKLSLQPKQIIAKSFAKVIL